MTPIPGQNQLVVMDDDTIAIRPKGGRRSMYLLLFAVLAAAAIFGFDPARDLSGSRLIYSIAFVVVALVLLYMGGSSAGILLDRKTRTCTRRTGIFGITIRSTSTSLGSGARILCQDVEIMKRPGDTDGKSGPLAGFLTARTHLYRLFLITDAGESAESRIRLEETTYPEGIGELGKTIADFLGIPFETEDM